ncbi:MAG: pantoate--beta-alanine ligase [Streptosporangiales bacterium]
MTTVRTLRTVDELRAALDPVRRAQQPVGLVPTMGALHEGHLSLIRRAREQCAVVVVSLFVNPAQFGRTADLATYPRDEQRDAALVEGAGADILFAPPADVVYPTGFATSVRVEGALTRTLEGACRGAAHFHGVTTVVTKLLTMTRPDAAYFGQKDAQQLAVVRRLVTDLDLPVRIEGCPTVREPDGLAMSSRNAHLQGEERERAVALYEALEAARSRVRQGERDVRPIREAALEAMRARAVEPEYAALVQPDSLAPVESITGPALLAVATHIGDTRLIDNTILHPASQ